MDWHEKTINEVYGGDVGRFEKAYAQAVTEGNRHCVSWKDFVLNETVLPDLKEATQDLIERRLGYLPHESVSITFVPFLRAFIQSHRTGVLSDQEFLSKADQQIKLIRNWDMRHNTCLVYDECIYQNYKDNYVVFRQAVKERLSLFLGYEPQLEHSLIAEMWMHDLMTDDTFEFPETITAIDYKAITLIKFREVLLQYGQDAAYSSPLHGNG